MTQPAPGSNLTYLAAANYLRGVLSTDNQAELNRVLDIGAPQFQLCFQALVHLPGSNQAVLVLAQHEHWSKQQQPDWREHVHALPPRAKPSLALPI